MTTVIDDLTVTTGWSSTAAGASFTVNTWADYISNYLAGSLLIHIPAGSLGKTFTKAVTASFPGAVSITLGVWSRQLRKTNQQKPSDYAYTIDFGGGHIFMLPTPMNFEAVDIGVNGWTSANQIQIVPQTNNEDWLIISGCYAVTDEYPLDIFTGIKSGISRAMGNFSLPSIGSLTVAAGSTFLTLPNWPQYLERYAVIQITDGTHTEIHQIERMDTQAGQVWFSSLYDGLTLKFSYSPGTVTLYIPVEFGVMEKEAIIPAITIWGMAPTDTHNETDVSDILDTFDPTGGGAIRKNIWLQTYTVLIDCEARTSQVLALLSRIVRWWMGTHTVWINGRKNDIGAKAQVNYIEPTEGVTEIPKIQYALEIEVAEERTARTFLPAFTTPVATFTPLPPGSTITAKTGGLNP